MAGREQHGLRLKARRQSRCRAPWAKPLRPAGWSSSARFVQPGICAAELPGLHPNHLPLRSWLVGAEQGFLRDLKGTNGIMPALRFLEGVNVEGI